MRARRTSLWSRIQNRDNPIEMIAREDDVDVRGERDFPSLRKPCSQRLEAAQFKKAPYPTAAICNRFRVNAT